MGIGMTSTPKPQLLHKNKLNVDQYILFYSNAQVKKI